MTMNDIHSIFYTTYTTPSVRAP